MCADTTRTASEIIVIAEPMTNNYERDFNSKSCSKQSSRNNNNNNNNNVEVRGGTSVLYLTKNENSDKTSCRRLGWVGIAITAEHDQQCRRTHNSVMELAPMRRYASQSKMVMAFVDKLTIAFASTMVAEWTRRITCIDSFQFIEFGSCSEIILLSSKNDE